MHAVPWHAQVKNIATAMRKHGGNTYNTALAATRIAQDCRKQTAPTCGEGQTQHINFICDSH
jgi:hypothetical protein